MAVNVAARLQGVAAAGDILITDDTLIRLSGAVAAHPLQPLHVKGVDKPIQIYRISSP
jgi:class 3 adenylate cyclase